MKIVVTGIGTDVGKTVVSAIIAQALNATYWKPIQAGDLAYTDSDKVRAYCDENVLVLPEAIRLKNAMSPHAAAILENVHPSESDFGIPNVQGDLIIEGAGGLCVPLNSDGLLYRDVIKSWGLPVVVVSRHYLGSINHTLLTVDSLKSEGIDIIGIVFVGDENSATESIIKEVTKLHVIGRIPVAKEVNSDFVFQQAELIKQSLMNTITLQEVK